MTGGAFQHDLATAGHSPLAVPVDPGVAAVVKTPVPGLDQFGEAGDGFDGARGRFSALWAMGAFKSEHGKAFRRPARPN